MPSHWFPSLPLLSLIGLALAYDIAMRRIPNWLVLMGLVAGLGCSLLANQAIGFSSLQASTPSVVGSMVGALTGLAIMLPLYLLRAMGAGDAKLMAVIGAFVGPTQVAGAALLTFAAGGLLSLIAAFGSGSLIRVLGNLRLMAFIAVSGRASGVVLRDVQTTGRLPYAVAIAVGTGLQIWLASGQKGWIFV